MSTSVIEPGTRLAGRYRLEKRISDTGGSSLWKAIDEILARAVAVRTSIPGSPGSPRSSRPPGRPAG
ncbi:hypothetical protein [Actinomadura sp. 9N215]|uniref:hypothetical protein n=1 Tax=Actinomadura sp. 9N215 TaxID=3375150 RepID=UPI00379EB23A